jgi:hypothetical protein
VPEAEFILWGARDSAGSRIHGTNESGDLNEPECFIVAHSLFLHLPGEVRLDGFSGSTCTKKECKILIPVHRSSSFL